MAKCTSCHRTYRGSSCSHCHSHHHHVHDNNHHHGCEGLPVVLAPGFTDYEILTDTAGYRYVFAGQQTVIAGAIANAMTPEMFLKMLRCATPAERSELRCELAAIVLSEDPDNNLSLGSDKGLFENDAVN